MNQSSVKMAAIPNPASDVVTIRVFSGLNVQGVLSILDVDGKVLKSQPVFLQNGSVDTKFNVKTLASGTYIVRLVSQGETKNIKLIVEH